MTRCSVGGCDRPLKSRGCCLAHYKRLLKYGDPLAGGAPRQRGRTCSIDGCDRKHDANGLCALHRKRQQARGDALFEFVRPTAERFWPKVDVRGEGECWPWTGCLNVYGYGQILHDGRVQGAHRVSLILAGVEIPQGRNVLHSCDNPPCVNPAHLRPGTQQENVADMWERGRGKPGKGRPRKVSA